MQKVIVEARAGNLFSIDYDNISYEFKITSYENFNGYAKIIVFDKTNDERYLCDGYIELNNHVIIARWNREYSDYRDNWICNKDLTITIE